MLYKGKKNIREYIMEMFNLMTRLKALKLELSEDILVHLVLISLPTQFSPFKISYNTQKEKRTLNELIAQCIESAHLASTSQGHGTNKKENMDNKEKETAYSGTSKQKVQKKQDKKITCFFCKKTCTKYAAWREKKGATTHISVTMQGCLRSRMPIDGERYIYVGNDNKAAVKAIDLFRLQLDSGCTLDLEETFVVIRQIFDGVWYHLSRHHSGTPSQNGVIERQNHTLKDMVRSCPAKARPYKPNEKKLDSKTVSCYFVGYFERSNGFKFYDPSIRSFFEMSNAKFIENNVQPTKIIETLEIPPTQVVEPVQVHEEITQEPQEPQVQVPLRRSNRERRSTISDDYVVYLQEHDGVWNLVELSEDVKSIGCKWIFKTQRDSKGNIARYKAYLVAKGFIQKEDIDYKETFSPVSSNDSFSIIMALVPHYDLELHQIDVKTAFLNGNIDETIYMENIVDQCIYLKFSGSKFIILVLYVDDILLASIDVELLHETKRFLSRKSDMKDLGNASFVLGIQIYRDRSRGILGLSQNSYIDKVLSRFGMSNYTPGDTPMAKGDKFSLHQCSRNELERKDMERFSYALAIGSLMYAQVCTRPDIAYIVGTLGRYLSNPGSSHLEIVGYSDSDFVGCLDSRKSTSSYIFMLAGGPISWKSVKQTLIASSTMETEFMACYEASNHEIWLRNFITKLRNFYRIEKPLRINCDNKTLELYSKNNRSSSKSKHIDIKFLVVKKKVQSLQVSIEHISTNYMIADPLTKDLPPKVYHEHVTHMGVVHINDVPV
ncbi:hypothetical protein AAG906_000666 [Vitis piasezkii]